MKTSTLLKASLCLTFLMGAAWAGTLTSFTPAKQTIKVNEMASFLVAGTAKCGVMIDNDNGHVWPIALTDPSASPSKSFGWIYNKPGIFVVTATPKIHGEDDCAGTTTPLQVIVEVVAVPRVLEPSKTPPKVKLAPALTPKPEPVCAKSAAEQARQKAAGVMMELCEPVKVGNVPVCAKSVAEQARQKAAGVMVELCEPVKVGNVPVCAKSVAEQARQKAAGVMVELCEPVKTGDVPTCAKGSVEQGFYVKELKLLLPICK